MLTLHGCRVVDGGRPGLGHLGIPRGGAADRELWAAALVLVGASPGTAALEAGPAPFRLEVHGGAVTVAVTGGCRLRVDGDGSPRRAQPWCTLRLQPGERLRGDRVVPGCRVVIGVAGELASRPVLGSRSPLPGDRPRAGEVVPVRAARTLSARRLLPPAWLLPRTVLDVVPGPQAEVLTAAGWEALAATTWTVSPASGRGGVRLEGPALPAVARQEVASQGTPPGAVQLPGSGRPVILLGERGTTGGYPVVATVVSADLAAAARLRPGAEVRLAVVDHARAAHRRAARTRALAALPRRLRPCEEF